MGIPLATGAMWAEQVVATSSVVAALQAAAPGARLSAPARAQLGAFLAAWGTFASSAQLPPLMPLPPPLPSGMLVYPPSWEKLVGWDKAARAWASYLGRHGAELAPLAPPPDAPPDVDPRSLGLGLPDIGIGLGGLALGLGAGLLVLALRR